MGFVRGLAIVAIAGAPLFLLNGCDNEGEDALLGPDPAKAEADVTQIAGPLASLTIDEIAQKVEMTADQRERLGDALEEAQARHGVRASGERPRFGRRGAGRHGGRGGPGGGEMPMLGFLDGASKILDSRQFLGLARLLAEKRDARLAELETAPWFGERGGPGREHGRAGGGGWAAFGDRAARHLNLTEDQKTRVAAVLDASREKILAIRREVAAGGLTREAARDRMHAVRLETGDAMRGILTAEQWEKAEGFRRDRMGDRIDERIDRMDDQLARRADFLARVLDLDASQAEAVRAAILATVSERTRILEQVKSGTLDPEDAFESIRAIEDELAEAIGGLLTPEQRAIWDELKDLLPGPPHARGR